MDRVPPVKDAYPSLVNDRIYSNLRMEPRQLDHSSNILNRSDHTRDVPNHRSTKYLLTLAAGWLGLQQIFTVFFGSGNFYLASLGLSNTLISLTWLSGPIAGMLFQPYIGAICDDHSSSIGRRRPFVLAGTAILILSILSLAWAKDITTYLSGLRTSGSHTDQQPQDSLYWDLAIFATVCIWAANLAIQPIQVGLRALVIDLIATDQQGQANAWIARLTMLGNMIGYFINSLDLTNYPPFSRLSQFQALCILVSINLCVCISVTCVFAQEKRMKVVGIPSDQRPSLISHTLSLFTNLKRLPFIIRKVCFAQFFCWMAWFPFLYYAARYVGSLDADQTGISLALDSLDENSSRAGSFAMLIFALASLIAAIALPLFVGTSHARERSEKVHNSRSSFSVTGRWFSLRRTWIVCQILFSVCMLASSVIDRVLMLYSLFALIGVSWAMASWIPFTIVAEETRHVRDMSETGISASDDDMKSSAATIVGLHNVAISSPQIVSALGSSLLFSVAGNVGTDSGGQSVEAWLLRAGGLSALGAVFAIFQIPENRHAYL